MLRNVMECFKDNTHQLVGDKSLSNPVPVKADEEAAFINGFQVTTMPIGIWAEGNQT